MQLVIFSFLSGCCLHDIKGVDFPLLENQRYSFGALTVVFNSLASCCPIGSSESLFIHLNALLNTYLI